ncbi:hypothetical protein Y032_0278g1156 [Ancylostoma ceylanicum]|uniref:Uncharacterized protein n=1 Tax=Ancylostoma ceylanicum TaxID=53326 RepID=A0A016S7Z9_9BILA|nr:hypothetical protein Y032_0278g1156 [Ancylostoma ceylanicum]
MPSSHLILFAVFALLSTFTTKSTAQFIFPGMFGGGFGGGMMNCAYSGWGMGYMGMYGGLGCGLGYGGFIGK